MNGQSGSCRFPEYLDQYDDTTRAAPGPRVPPRRFHLEERWRAIYHTLTDFAISVTSIDLEYGAEDEISDDLTSSARGNGNSDSSSDQNPGISGRILIACANPKGTKVDKGHWGFDSA